MAKPSKDKKDKLIHKIRDKFRLVIINDATFEEKFSMSLTPLNVFTWGGVLLILFSISVSSIIAFTPIREMIPGYADVSTKKQASYAALKADSLQYQLDLNKTYLDNIQKILKGENTEDFLKPDLETDRNYDTIKIRKSIQDSLLRAQVELEDKYNLSFQGDKTDGSITSFTFFTPLKGLITSEYNPGIKHYGVDVASEQNEAVKATLGGTVTMATWTSETGHVLQIQHNNNIISIYKHNSVLLKSVGDKVKAGEAVAMVGNTGELTSGPHLHFELWYKGQSVNPQDYISFR